MWTAITDDTFREIMIPMTSADRFRQSAILCLDFPPDKSICLYVECFRTRSCEMR